MIHRTSKEVVTDAKEILEETWSHIQSMSGHPGADEFAENLANGYPMFPAKYASQYRALRENRPDLYAELNSCAADNAIFKTWQRARTVYAMDDYLLEHLNDLSSTNVPTEVLRSIPHPNPFVLLPRPDENDPYYEEDLHASGVPLGAFLFGRFIEAKMLCGTNAEEFEDLGIMFVTKIEEANGNIIWSFLRCTVPLHGYKTVSVQDAVDRTIARFRFNDSLGPEHREHLTGWLSRHVRQVFNSVLYVCTEQPDIEDYRPAVRQAPGKKGKKPKPERRLRPNDFSSLLKVGFKLGPALHAQRERARTAQSMPVATGKGGWRHQPRQRAGGYRTFWTGHGRTIPKIKLVMPYWVSLDLLEDGDGPEDVIIHPVK